MDEISQALAGIQAATERLLATVARLSDRQAGEPSLLPGWTRGHVLTHIARNADGLAHLLRWASTGTEIPMYESQEARDADIEAGAARGAAILAADVRDSAAAFAKEATAVPEHGWTVLVRALRGDPFPAYGVLARRLSEVEIHHVDLAAGYRPGDWPQDFVADALPEVAATFAGRDDAPACQVVADGTSHILEIGPAGHTGTGEAPNTAAGQLAATGRTSDTGPGRAQHAGTMPLVSGPAHDLLAWLLGRGSGDGLTVHQAGAVPVMPPWR